MRQALDNALTWAARLQEEVGQIEGAKGSRHWPSTVHELPQMGGKAQKWLTSLHASRCFRVRVRDADMATKARLRSVAGWGASAFLTTIPATSLANYKWSLGFCYVWDGLNRGLSSVPIGAGCLGQGPVMSESTRRISWHVHLAAAGSAAIINCGMHVSTWRARQALLCTRSPGADMRLSERRKGAICWSWVRVTMADI